MTYESYSYKEVLKLVNLIYKSYLKFSKEKETKYK